MINNRKHIILIALFQLMVFLTPFAVKSLHIHIHSQVENNNELSFHKSEKTCAICNFEFVQVIAKSPLRIQHYIPIISIVISYFESQYDKTPYYAYNLRGPPKF